MSTLILKLGAAGDVVRTTTLLHRLEGEVVWLTSPLNRELLEGVSNISELVDWEHREELAGRSFDRIINLEDSEEAAEFLDRVRIGTLSGAFRTGAGKVRYSQDLSEWFDMSLIGRFGREEADRLKLTNRRSYQEILFRGLGFEFQGEPYLLPQAEATDLAGDVAIAPMAGSVWPSKNWAHFDELAGNLTRRGFTVNFLPHRQTLRQHLGDIQNHRCLVSGDSLPMHLALGRGIPCVTIFTCTSPWEIYDYGIQRKIVSPLLERHFYTREFNEELVRSVGVEEVLGAVGLVLGAGC